MKKITWLILTFILSTTIAYANLTNGNLPATKNGASNPPTVQNSPVSTDGTNVSVSTLQGSVTVNGTTGTLSVPGSISSTGTLGAVQFPQVPTPGANPSAATDYLYIKNDDKLYTLNSAGSETAVQAGQWTGTNPVYITGKNIGIGSATPGQLLDVQGTVRALYFSGNGAALTNLPAGSAAGSPNQIQYNSGGSFAGSSNFIFNGTNVGIGSTVPGQILDVGGTIRTTGFNLNSGSSLNNKILTSDSNGNGSWQVNAGTSQWTGTAGQPIFYANNVGIGTSNAPTGLLNVAGGVNIGTSYATYQVVPTNGLAVQGNVGLGTWAPTKLLDIGLTHGATIDSTGAIIGLSAALTNGLTTNSTGGFFDKTQAVGANNGASFNIGNTSSTSASFTTLKGSAATNGHVIIETTTGVGSGDYTQFWGGNAGATTIATFMGTGNIGIGSTVPGQILDVQGTIRISKLGSTIAIASGTNGCQGQGTLVSGTVTITTTCTPTTSQGIFLQDATTGSLVNVGTPTVGTVTSGTSFVINSSNTLDTSNINWWIVKQN